MSTRLFVHAHFFVYTSPAIVHGSFTPVHTKTIKVIVETEIFIKRGRLGTRLYSLYIVLPQTYQSLNLPT